MKPLILIADRENLNALSLAQTISGRHARYRVKIATTTETAAAIIHHERPACSIIAHALPGGSGTSLVQRFAGAPGYKGCAFLAVVESEHLATAAPPLLEAGVDGIFPTPVQIRDLATRLAELVYLGRNPGERKMAVVIGEMKAALRVETTLAMLQIRTVPVGQDLPLAIALARSPNTALVLVNDPVEVMSPGALIEYLRSQHVRVPVARIGGVKCEPHPLVHDLAPGFGAHDVDRILAKAIRAKYAIPGRVSVTRRDSARA
jgi:CheY-like chemotaxis protein